MGEGAEGARSGRSASGLGQLEQSLAVAADLAGLTEALARGCAWMGLVGWALMLFQRDGTHLFPCALAGLGKRWQPPLRPLSTQEAWPVGRAALGQECVDCGTPRPYPLPAKAGTAAWMVLPLAKGQGVAVALRPGLTAFGPSELDYLRDAVSLLDRYLPGVQRTGHAEQSLPRLTQRSAGAFRLDLADESVEGDEIFARQHALPGPGRFPLADILRRVPAQDLPRIEEILHHLRERPGTFEAAYRLTLDGGHTRHLRAHCTSSSGGTDQPMTVSGHVTDITTDTHRTDARETLLREQLRRADRMISLAASAASASGTREVAAAACEALAVFGADALVIADARHGHTHVVTAVGYDDEHRAAVDHISLTARAPLTDALRNQEAHFIPSHHNLVAAYPHYAAALPRLKRQAWAAIPLPLADPSTPAACMFSFNRPHAFQPADQPLLIAAAALLGRALERCRTYDTEHERAVRLQRSLLPTHLPQHPALHLAASYHPAAPQAHAGGDWYDAFPLPDGRIALTIGDVEGHHTKAAALMGRLRTTLRAYAALTPNPAAVLRRTNALLTADNDADPDHALLATCCLIALDPDTGRVDVATAAHPTPLIHTPDDLPETRIAPGLPLGIVRDTRYPTTRLTLPPHSRVLLHTDGLTDTPHTDPDHARDRLRRLLAATAHDAAALALHQITTSCIVTPHPHDDSALLLAHLVPAGRQ
ncbi:PP2C family protein-serine/threonine phosphatase [Streptomyces hilarionis]|uniref:PP2C family protein-serine/threonine phosphatase n=1 Tax=Streptomyces hilarionis TaxID=2839954 RepID=UPI002119D406|nr:PP2C family protein-serine/threonine phosphatase [Streptomyces hilarionis]MCQ9130368.1 serine/threonine-protein phosphatase [Streptomyces hilarionis]